MRPYAFHVSDHDVPASLIDAEGGLAASHGVFICSRDDPSWCIADSQIENLALLNEHMQGVHNLAVDLLVVVRTEERCQLTKYYYSNPTNANTKYQSNPSATSSNYP